MCTSTPSVPKPIPAQEIKQPVADVLRRRKMTGPGGGTGGAGVGGGSLLAGSATSLAGGASTAGTSMLGG